MSNDSLKNGDSSDIRVNENALSYDNEDALLYEGKLFTGIGYAEYPDGTLRREVKYVRGFPQGVCHEWHKNGQLRKEWYAEPSVAPSKTTEWYEDGHIKSSCIREHGIELEYKEWDKEGNLIVERKLNEDSPMHKLLERMRTLKNQA